jgi:hypothetical protein
LRPTAAARTFVGLAFLPHVKDTGTGKLVQIQVYWLS